MQYMHAVQKCGYVLLIVGVQQNELKRELKCRIPKMMLKMVIVAPLGFEFEALVGICWSQFCMLFFSWNMGTPDDLTL